MKRVIVAALVSVLALLMGVNGANASLATIGTATYGGSEYKLIYDIEDQRTWLDYSNTGATHPESLAWAASLNTALAINLYEGHSASWESTEWRLAGNTTGFWNNASSNAITSSEMEDLYYSELGNVLNDASLNFGAFENLTASYYHMSADPALAAQLGVSWSPRFLFFNGVQEFGTSSVNGSGISGMAVHPGEVSIPEPATLSLLAIGLGALAIRRRRRA